MDQNYMESQQTNGSSSEDVVKQLDKRPSKTTRKQRVNALIHKINNDSLDLVVSDILNENKRLRRELESLRVQNAGLKREYEELMHSILSDRLNNQAPHTSF